MKSENFFNTSVATPIGPFSLALLDEVVVEAIFAPVAQLHYQGRFFKELSAIHPHLVAYFKGELDSLSKIAVEVVDLNFTGMVYRQLQKIPAGSVLSYQELAARSGSARANRAAGSACAKNKIPLLIPCHRVIKSDGSLGRYAFGSDRKKWLLEHEGYFAS
jgi:methylated-DNA-[protein]-cysteine S-methyltransferase